MNSDLHNKSINYAKKAPAPPNVEPVIEEQKKGQLLSMEHKGHIHSVSGKFYPKQLQYYIIGAC